MEPFVTVFAKWHSKVSKGIRVFTTARPEIKFCFSSQKAFAFRKSIFVHKSFFRSKGFFCESGPIWTKRPFEPEKAFWTLKTFWAQNGAKMTKNGPKMSKNDPFWAKMTILNQKFFLNQIAFCDSGWIWMVKNILHQKHLLNQKMFLRLRRKILNDWKTLFPDAL